MLKLSLEQLRRLEFDFKINDKSIPAESVFIDDADMVQTLAVIYQQPKFSHVKGQDWFRLAFHAKANGWTLSDKQITQLKRQSNSVVDFLLGYVCNSFHDMENEIKLKEFYKNFQ